MEVKIFDVLLFYCIFDLFNLTKIQKQ